MIRYPLNWSFVWYNQENIESWPFILLIYRAFDSSNDITDKIVALTSIFVKLCAFFEILAPTFSLGKAYNIFVFVIIYHFSLKGIVWVWATGPPFRSQYFKYSQSSCTITQWKLSWIVFCQSYHVLFCPIQWLWRTDQQRTGANWEGTRGLYVLWRQYHWQDAQEQDHCGSWQDCNLDEHIYSPKIQILLPLYYPSSNQIQGFN